MQTRRPLWGDKQGWDAILVSGAGRGKKKVEPIGTAAVGHLPDRGCSNDDCSLGVAGLRFVLCRADARCQGT